MIEREEDEEDPLPQLAACRAVMQKRSGPRIGSESFDETIRLFEERQILPKPLFDALTDAAKKKAFTVAGLALEELLGDAHAELARQIRESKEKTYFDEVNQKWVYKGPNLREFDKFARERLEKSGWVPANPSHVETILRTNVMGAYSSGRIVETTQPAVIAARPYWQIVGVGDSRQRKTHRKAHGTILAADHPFWRKAYPPFGFNCRCRVISRSKRWVDAHGGPTRVPEGLPDKGFASGIDAALVPTTVVQQDGQRPPTEAQPAHPIPRPRETAPIRLPPVNELPTAAHPPDYFQPINRAADDANSSSESAFEKNGVLVGDYAKVQKAAEKFLGEKLTPNRVKELMATENALPGATVKYRAYAYGDADALMTSATIRDAKGESVADIVRTYTVNEAGQKVVHHDLLKLTEKYQDSKIGSEIFKSQIRQYLALGVSKVETEAAWVGQYYWPSVGYQLRDPSVLSRLKRQFKNYLEASGIAAEAAALVSETPQTLHGLAMARIGKRKVGKEFLLNRGDSGASLIDLELDLADGSESRRILRERLGI